METGNKNIQSNYLVKDSSLDGNRIKQCHTIFNLREDGIGILISDHSKKHLLALGNYSWPHKPEANLIIESLEKFFLEADFNFDDCLSSRWFLTQKQLSLVPLEFFEDGMEQDILQLSSKPNIHEEFRSDVWTKQQIVCCYRIPKLISEWLQFNFAQSEVHHSAKALYNLYNHYPQHGAYAHLHVEEGKAELMLANEGRLMLYNMFDYKVHEDLLYFLLFALEQSRLLAPEVSLKLSGVSGIDDLQGLLNEYIGTVQKVKLPEAFTAPSSISSTQIERSFHLLGGL